MRRILPQNVPHINEGLDHYARLLSQTSTVGPATTASHLRMVWEMRDEQEDAAFGSASAHHRDADPRRQLSRPSSAASRSWAVRIAEALLLVVVVAVAVVLLARWRGWVVGPLAFTVALVPWWVLVAALATMALAILRRWAAAGVGILVVLVGATTLIPVFTSTSVEGEPGGVVTVMSINLTKGAADTEAVLSLVESRNVDILAVQEITPGALRKLQEGGIAKQFPHSFVRTGPGVRGTALWSRTPLSNQRELEGFRFVQLKASSTVAGTKLTVLSAHPVPPSARLSGAWRIEQEQLLAAASAIDGPALLVGDLNATSDHPALRELGRRGWRESRDQAGAGPVLTFPTVSLPFPVAALDRSYVSQLDWLAINVEAIDIPGADHRALVVNYQAPQGVAVAQ